MDERIATLLDDLKRADSLEGAELAQRVMPQIMGIDKQGSGR